MPSGGRKNEWILMVVEKGQERKNMLKAYSKEKKKYGSTHTLFLYPFIFKVRRLLRPSVPVGVVQRRGREREADGGEGRGATKRR
jgi:hypothetical protein